MGLRWKGTVDCRDQYSLQRLLDMGRGFITVKKITAEVIMEDELLHKLDSEGWWGEYIWSLNEEGEHG